MDPRGEERQRLTLNRRYVRVRPLKLLLHRPVPRERIFLKTK